MYPTKYPIARKYETFPSLLLVHTVVLCPSSLQTWDWNTGDKSLTIDALNMTSAGFYSDLTICWAYSAAGQSEEDCHCSSLETDWPLMRPCWLHHESRLMIIISWKSARGVCDPRRTWGISRCRHNPSRIVLVDTPFCFCISFSCLIHVVSLWIFLINLFNICVYSVTSVYKTKNPFQLQVLLKME
jgi:hypothetical protein